MAEFLAGPKARTVIMEFWNSGETGIEVNEGIKTKKTAFAAIHDCGLVGKVTAVERVIDGAKRLFLINKEKMDNGNNGEKAA